MTVYEFSKESFISDEYCVIFDLQTGRSVFEGDLALIPEELENYEVVSWNLEIVYPHKDDKGSPDKNKPEPCIEFNIRFDE